MVGIRGAFKYKGTERKVELWMKMRLMVFTSTTIKGGNMFKVGDVVRLKTGGELMTIVEKIDKNLYNCKWFAGIELRDGVFQEESLEQWIRVLDSFYFSQAKYISP